MNDNQPMKISILQVHRVHQENQGPLENQGHRDLVVVEVVQEHLEKTALRVERALKENQERAQTLMLPCFKSLSNNCRRLIKQM